uniref:Uncharacterized protein n=1 Tax=Pyrodinium bahamense TaxID=73915 RepID=A0A7S0FSH8_9DINO
MDGAVPGVGQLAAGQAWEPSTPMRALLRAAAQAICDSGGGMGETVTSVEEALVAQVHAAGVTSVEQVALLASSGERCMGSAALEPQWRLSITGTRGPGVCMAAAGADSDRGKASCGPLLGKRRRVVA